MSENSFKVSRRSTGRYRDIATREVTPARRSTRLRNKTRQGQSYVSTPTKNASPDEKMDNVKMNTSKQEEESLESNRKRKISFTAIKSEEDQPKIQQRFSNGVDEEENEPDIQQGFSNGIEEVSLQLEEDQPKIQQRLSNGVDDVENEAEIQQPFSNEMDEVENEVKIARQNKVKESGHEVIDGTCCNTWSWIEQQKAQHAMARERYCLNRHKERLLGEPMKEALAKVNDVLTLGAMLTSDLDDSDEDISTMNLDFGDFVTSYTTPFNSQSELVSPYSTPLEETDFTSSYAASFTNQNNFVSSYAAYFEDDHFSCDEDVQDIARESSKESTPSFNANKLNNSYEQQRDECMNKINMHFANKDNYDDVGEALEESPWDYYPSDQENNIKEGKHIDNNWKIITFKLLLILLMSTLLIKYTNLDAHIKQKLDENCIFGRDSNGEKYGTENLNSLEEDIKNILLLNKINIDKSSFKKIPPSNKSCEENEEIIVSLNHSYSNYINEVDTSHLIKTLSYQMTDKVHFGGNELNDSSQLEQVSLITEDSVNSVEVNVISLISERGDDEIVSKINQIEDVPIMLKEAAKLENKYFNNEVVKEDSSGTIKDIEVERVEYNNEEVNDQESSSNHHENNGEVHEEQSENKDIVMEGEIHHIIDPPTILKENTILKEEHDNNEELHKIHEGKIEDVQITNVHPKINKEVILEDKQDDMSVIQDKEDTDLIEETQIIEKLNQIPDESLLSSETSKRRIQDTDKGVVIEEKETDIIKDQGVTDKTPHVINTSIDNLQMQNDGNGVVGEDDEVKSISESNLSIKKGDEGNSKRKYIESVEDGPLQSTQTTVLEKNNEDTGLVYEDELLSIREDVGKNSLPSNETTEYIIHHDNNEIVDKETKSGSKENVKQAEKNRHSNSPISLTVKKRIQKKNNKIAKHNNNNEEWKQTLKKLHNQMSQSYSLWITAREFINSAMEKEQVCPTLLLVGSTGSEDALNCVAHQIVRVTEMALGIPGIDDNHVGVVRHIEQLSGSEANQLISNCNQKGSRNKQAALVMTFQLNEISTNLLMMSEVDVPITVDELVKEWAVELGETVDEELVAMITRNAIIVMQETEETLRLLCPHN